MKKEIEDYKNEVLKNAIDCPVCNKKGLLFFSKSIHDNGDVYLHCAFCRHSIVVNDVKKEMRDLGREAVEENNDYFFTLLYDLEQRDVLTKR